MTPNQQTPPSNMYIEVLKRARLPEVLLVEDVAIALKLTPRSARQALKRGDFGPFCRQGRKIMILRGTFIAAIEERQIPEFKLLNTLLAPPTGHSSPSDPLTTVSTPPGAPRSAESP